MSRRVAKHTMGIQDNNSQNTYKRDVVLATYESETVIPAEVGLTSYRVDNHNESRNDKVMRLQLDLEDEVRVTAE